MFGIDDAIIIGSMLFGAGGASLAHGKRTRQQYQNLVRAQWEAEKIKEDKTRTKRILTGDMNISALQNTAQAREAAMQAFQAEAGAEAALGVSGMTSGTPFYKLQQDIRDNATRLSEMDEMARIGMENRRLQAKGAMEGNKIQEARADWAVADMQAEMNYLDSLSANLMAIATGGFQGAATGMQIVTGMTKLGMIKPKVKPIGAAGVKSSDISDSDYYTMTDAASADSDYYSFGAPFYESDSDYYTMTDAASADSDYYSFGNFSRSYGSVNNQLKVLPPGPPDESTAWVWYQSSNPWASKGISPPGENLIPYGGELLRPGMFYGLKNGLDNYTPNRNLIDLSGNILGSDTLSSLMMKRNKSLFSFGTGWR